MRGIKQLAGSRLPTELFKLALQKRCDVTRQLCRVLYIALYVDGHMRREGELLVDLRGLRLALLPLDKLREQYFRNLNERSFVAEIENGRIPLPITTLDTSRKAPKFAHIRHVAALIDIRAYKADEEMGNSQTESDSPT